MNREFSSGGVVYRKFQNPNSKFQIKWLVTKSTPSKLRPRSTWRLPKGRLDDEGKGKKSGPLARGERKASEREIQDAAVKEVREEGGVRARIIDKIGTEKYYFTWQGEKILKFVTYYLMEWIADLPEGFGFETSEVAWLPYEEARMRLKHTGEKKVLDKAGQVLEAGVQESLV